MVPADISPASMLQLPLIDIVPPSLQPQNDFEFLATHGYLIKSGLFEEELIEAVREWTDNRFSQEDMTGEGRLQDAFHKSDDVTRLAAHPAVLAMLQELYGRRPIPFQTLNFPRGTEQHTHADTIHFNSWPQRWMCGVWVALQDVTELNGPLHYYPGSHRLPVLDTIDTSASGNRYANYEAAVQELIAIAGLKKERFLPRKGDCLVWAANLLHGGEPIIDPQSSRFSQVTHYYFEGCDFFTPILSDTAISRIHFRDAIQDIASGEIIHSRHSRQLASDQQASAVEPVPSTARVRQLLSRLRPRRNAR